MLMEWKLEIQEWSNVAHIQFNTGIGMNARSDGLSLQKRYSCLSYTGFFFF